MKIRAANFCRPLFCRLIVTVLILTPLAAFGADAKIELFDMEAIRDPKTLDIEILQDWHRPPGPFNVRQKLVTINVGEIWPGQVYRIPVKMVVPEDRKASISQVTIRQTN